MFDFLIVGAGFAGATLAERIATQLDKRVILIDKRKHIGGNAYDHYHSSGFLVHKYGPHLFHTNSPKVFDYLSQFTHWHEYIHKVYACIDNKQVPIPFSLSTIYAIFPVEEAQKYESELLSNYSYGSKISILKLRENSSGILRKLADFIYEKLFYNYTLKQWGLKPEELSESVTARVPIYISHDDRYFTDKYQYMPNEGYTKIFERMINHKNIKLIPNIDFSEIVDIVNFNKLIFTGPIDEYFGYMYGELPYRSLEFADKIVEQEYFQDVAIVNYPDGKPYTRIVEYKHITKQIYPKSCIVYEYPKSFINKEEQNRYYPIPRDINRQLYKKYQMEAQKLKNVFFCGRLGEYIYYNMDQVVAKSLTLFEETLSKE